MARRRGKMQAHYMVRRLAEYTVGGKVFAAMESTNPMARVPPTGGRRTLRSRGVRIETGKR